MSQITPHSFVIHSAKPSIILHARHFIREKDGSAINGFFARIGDISVYGLTKERDTVSPMAWGLYKAIEESGYSNKDRINVFVKNSAIEKYLNQYAPGWVAGGLTSRNEPPEALMAWRHLLPFRGSICFSRIEGPGHIFDELTRVRQQLDRMSVTASAVSGKAGLISCLKHNGWPFE